MTSGEAPFHVNELLLVKPGHGTKADLSPWMETVPGKVTMVIRNSCLMTWKYLGDDAPLEVRRHPAWTQGWYIDYPHLQPTRTVTTTHEAW